MGVLCVVLVGLEPVPVVSVQSVQRANPHKALVVLGNAEHAVADEPILAGQAVKANALPLR